ncbi:MAG: RING finger domain-containing protein [Promethearchaeota archaeon]
MNKIKFCPSCGKRLQGMNESQMNYCIFCGTKLRNNNKTLKLTSQCAICHEYVSLKKSDSLKCPFCGSEFHSTCINSWLLKYNSCPRCMTEFLMPKVIPVEVSR